MMEQKIERWTISKRFGRERIDGPETEGWDRVEVVPAAALQAVEEEGRHWRENAAAAVLREQDEKHRAEAAERDLKEERERLLTGGAEALARNEYEVLKEELGDERSWEEETQGHRNIYLDAARERVSIALASLANYEQREEKGGDVGSSAGVQPPQGPDGSIRRISASAAPSAEPSTEETCKRCGGKGTVVGPLGLTGLTGGYPCPDCAPVQALEEEG
jgi:hypothetical protein